MTVSFFPAFCFPRLHVHLMKQSLSGTRSASLLLQLSTAAVSFFSHSADYHSHSLFHLSLCPHPATTCSLIHDGRLTEGVFKLKPSPADNVQKYDPNHGPAGGLITPIIVSSLILMVIFLIGCVVCSRDSFYPSRCNNNQRNHESGEKSIL